MDAEASVASQNWSRLSTNPHNRTGLVGNFRASPLAERERDRGAPHHHPGAPRHHPAMGHLGR